MIELAKSQDGIVYYRLEHPHEIDKLRIEDYTYFKKYLGMSDYTGNFKSWLKRKNVLLIVAVCENRVIGWVMNERWYENVRDGKPASVLRAIEVLPEITGKGIGKNLFSLSSEILVGHFITKPVNDVAKKFFMSLEFTSAKINGPIDLSNHPGYMALYDSMKAMPNIPEGIVFHKENIDKCKNQLFANEKEELIKATVKGKITNNAQNLSVKDTQQTAHNKIKEEKKASSTRTSTSENQIMTEPGIYIETQKMMSPCVCGNFNAKKYMVSDERNGIAVICSECERERYFLPKMKSNR